MILKIIAVLFAIGCLIGIVCQSIELINYVYEFKIVDCYDKEANKIIGQQCIEESSIHTHISILLLLLVLGFFIPYFLWVGDTFFLNGGYYDGK